MAKWDEEKGMADREKEYSGLEQLKAQCATEGRPSAQAAAGMAFSEDGLLDHMFRYHPPDHTQLPKYSTLREAARHFAKTILMNVPAGADRTAALRKVREAVMTADAAIACDGVSF